MLIAARLLGPVGAKIAGAVVLGSAAAVGSEIADRTGLTDRITSGLMTLAGLPVRRPALPPSASAPIGAAEPVVTKPHCPICFSGPTIAGAGEAVEIKPHDVCMQRAEQAAASMASNYAGWAQAAGVDVKRADAPMPMIGDAGMRNAVGVPDLVRYAAQLRDWQSYMAGIGAAVDVGLSVDAECGPMPTIANAKDILTGLPSFAIFTKDMKAWQDCTKKVAKANKAIDAATAKAKADAATEQKRAERKKFAESQAASFALRRAQDATEKKIADARAAEAAAADAAQKAELQKQIEILQAQKETADRLAEQVRQQSADAARQKELDDLRREITEKGKTPGGMDEYLKMVLMQRMMAPPAAPVAAPWAPPAAPPLVYVDPYGQQVAQPAYAPHDFAPPDPYAGDPYAGIDIDFMGSKDQPVSKDTADAMGLKGARTLGEVEMLADYRDAYGDEFEELAEALDVEIDGDDGASCYLGGCGLGATPAV